jgi:ParB family transcriptional regulator, chromosome partitioning protein
MARRTFGEGLNDVFGKTKAYIEEIEVSSGVHREFKTVLPNEIKPGVYQPRRDFDQHSLQELADSIKEKGILQPLIVRKSGKGYEIIAGERRWRAAQMAGLDQIPIVICEINDNDALAFSLIENIQRQDLNPIEEAIALNRLIEEFTMTHEEVAKSIGRSRTMVTNMLRLLNLEDLVKEMLISHHLEMGHARALLSLSESKQITVAKFIVDKQMTVREAEAYVRLLQTNKVMHKVIAEKDDRLLVL